MEKKGRNPLVHYGRVKTNFFERYKELIESEAKTKKPVSMRELYILSKRIWLYCHELDIDLPEEVSEVLAEVLQSEVDQKMDKGMTGFVTFNRYDFELYNFVEKYIDNNKTKTISDAIRKYIRDNNRSLKFESVKKQYYRQRKKGLEILNEVIALDKDIDSYI